MVLRKELPNAARRYHSVIMADKEPTLTFDERLNRIAWVLQEQSRLLSGYIQFSHDLDAKIAALAEQSAKHDAAHDAARADHEGRIGRLEAAMANLAEQSAKHESRFAKVEAAIDRLVEESLTTERRWQAYLNTLPKQ